MTGEKVSFPLIGNSSTKSKKAAQETARLWHEKCKNRRPDG